MKKIMFGLLFAITMISNSVAQDFPYGEEFHYPTEYGNLTVYEKYIIQDDQKIKSTIKAVNGYLSISSKEAEYVALNCIADGHEFVSLFKKDDKTYEYGLWEIPYNRLVGESSSKVMPMLQAFSFTKAESYVTEKGKKGKDIDFVPVEFFGLTDNPWAVNETSENKKIHLGTAMWRNSRINYSPIEAIIVVNGFVYPGKEKLYKENARAKTIRISYDDTTFDYELKDTGNYQVIELPKTMRLDEKNGLTIEILNWYKGTKYKDIVMSGIYYVDISSF